MSSIRCLLNHHAVGRLSVHFDGSSHRGTCKRCGVPMMFERGSGWRATASGDHTAAA